MYLLNQMRFLKKNLLVYSLKNYSRFSTSVSRKMLQDSQNIEKNDSFDIVICGGGMVGTSMALALGQDPLFKNLKIALIDSATEKKNYIMPLVHNNRVCALSSKTIDFFKKIGCFDFIEQNRFGEVRNMHVWDESSDAFISFRNEDGSNLAIIVENDLILASLNKNLSDFNNLKVIYSSKIKDLNENEQYINLKLNDDKTFTTKLLIGSDGADSFIRKKLEFKNTKWEYDQIAIVSTLKLAEKESNNTAWQRFLSTGPIALLPLNDEYSSLVWSVKKYLAKELLSLDDESFVHKINEAFIQENNKNQFGVSFENITQTGLDLIRNAIPNAKNYISDRDSTVRILPPKIQSAGLRSSFPLSFLHSNNYVKKNTVLIGDSIHKVHPLAGQGVNLGFGDVLCLYECLRENVLSGAEIGSWNYLKKYESERQKQIFLKLAGIDALYRLYTDHSYPDMLVKTPLVCLRTFGLTMSNRLLFLKNFFIQEAKN